MYYISQIAVAGRYKTIVLPLIGNATATAFAFTMPQDCYIRSATLGQGVIAVGGPTAINIGNSGTAAAYGTIAPSATQAANSVVNGTVTGLLIPKGTVILVAAAANTTGTSQITLEIENLETT